MIRFLTLLILTLVLAGIWLVTAATLQISGQDYLHLTMPWWHLLLHVAWLATGLATSMLGVILVLDRQSRDKLTSSPPQQT